MSDEGDAPLEVGSEEGVKCEVQAVMKRFDGFSPGDIEVFGT